MTATRNSIQHLTILAIFYYILGGLSLVGGVCLPVVYTTAGVAILTIGLGGDRGAGNIVGSVMIACAVMAFVIGVVTGSLLIACGQCLRKRKDFVYCVVIAVLTCLNMPLGTVLGVFTMVVLFRQGVRELFP